MRNQSKRNTHFNKHRKNLDRFIVTNDLNLITSYADFDICIEIFFSRFGPNDVILYNRNFGFALIQYNDFCPMNIQDDPYCTDFIYINENQRGKAQGRRFMKLILNHFQIVIQTLVSSLGFFQHISEDLGLEKINTGLPFDYFFRSSKLNVNRLPIVNSCPGICGLKFSGYERCGCPKCSMGFVMEKTHKDLIKLDKSLRFKSKKDYQSAVTTLITQE